MKAAAKKNDTSLITDGDPVPSADGSDHEADRDEVDVARADGRDDAPTEVISASAVQEASPADSKPSQPADMSDYEPLGIWTVGWGQLFPWLVTGHDNRIKDASFLDVIRLRTLLQDCLSLTSLYSRLAGAGAKLFMTAEDLNLGNAIDFVAIADEFIHRGGDYHRVPRLELAHRRGGRCQESNRNCPLRLGCPREAIYTKWAKVPALRQCELGAGIVFSTPDTGSARNAIDSITSSPADLRPFTWGDLWLKPTDFDQTAGNYTEFSQKVKEAVVLPDPRIVVFASNGVQPQSGFLSALIGLHGTEYEFLPTYRDTVVTCETAHAYTYEKAQSPEPPNPTVTVPGENGSVLVFEDSGSGYLKGYHYTLNLNHEIRRSVGVVAIYPIPYSAANGVTDWKGTSLTTGMGDLPAVLTALRTNLGALNQWTLTTPPGMASTGRATATALSSFDRPTPESSPR